jgi:hypothetical protein
MLQLQKKVKKINANNITNHNNSKHFSGKYPTLKHKLGAEK